MFSPKITTTCLMGVAVDLAPPVACEDAAVAATTPQATSTGRIQRIRLLIGFPLLGRWTGPILDTIRAVVGDAAATTRRRSGDEPSHRTESHFSELRVGCVGGHRPRP